MKFLGSRGKRAIKQGAPSKIRRVIYRTASVLGAAMLAASLGLFIYIAMEEAAARDESEQIREIFFSTAAPDATTGAVLPDEHDGAQEAIAEEYEPQEEEAISDEELRRLTMEELLELNSDFVGWISMAVGLIE